MKTRNILTALFCLSFQSLAFAHCPFSYKEEKVCFMLDANVLYIYDHAVEHNGPYKDLEKTTLTNFKTVNGESIPFKKVARGIYKIEVKEKQKTVILEMTQDKKKRDIKVSSEPY